MKGQFHISTEELCDAVVAVESEKKRQAREKGKRKGKALLYNNESEEDFEVRRARRDR